MNQHSDLSLLKADYEAGIQSKIDIAKKHGPYNKAIDIGTGSGNIAIVLSKENIAKHIDAIDISKQALDVAKYNGSQYNIKNINYFQLDFLMNDIIQKYDYAR